MQDCDACEVGLSKPLFNQVIFLHNFRQLLVYWQNTVQLICYESSESGGDSWRDLSGGTPARERKLPLHHNFNFHKVAMDSYALNWRLAHKSSR